MRKWASFLSKPFSNKNKQSVQEEKCCLLFSNISFCFSDIPFFKICRLAKWWHHTLSWWTMMKEDISVNLNQKWLILCSKILLFLICLKVCPVELQATSRLHKELGQVSNFNQAIIWHHYMKGHVEIIWLNLMLLRTLLLWTIRWV